MKQAFALLAALVLLATVAIAVPGMPIGSPGMEGPNPESYRVLSFDRAGRIATFEEHTP